MINQSNNPTAQLAQQMAQRVRPIPGRQPYQRPGMPELTGAVGAMASGNATPTQFTNFFGQPTPTMDGTLSPSIDINRWRMLRRNLPQQTVMG